MKYRKVECLLSALLVGMCFDVSGQEVAHNIDTLHSIMRKWKIMTFESRGFKIDVPATRAIIMEYYANGTMVTNISGSKITQKWKYDKTVGAIIIDEKLKILKISGKEMILQ